MHMCIICVSCSKYRDTLYKKNKVSKQHGRAIKSKGKYDSETGSFGVYSVAYYLLICDRFSSM